jgi:hypothetical protein
MHREASPKKQSIGAEKNWALAHRSEVQVHKIQAAVLRKKGGPLRIESLEPEGPRDDEVLVRIVASGIFHRCFCGYASPHCLLAEFAFSNLFHNAGVSRSALSPVS